ncbi:unnamed protein product [Gadus morhua 'NCC']
MGVTGPHSQEVMGIDHPVCPEQSLEHLKSINPWRTVRGRGLRSPASPPGNGGTRAERGEELVKQTLVKQTGVKQTLVKQTLVKQTLVKQTGVKQTLVKQTLVKQTLVKQTGVKQTLVKQTGVKQTLVKQTGVKQTLVKQTLVKQTGVKQTLVKQTGVKQTLVKQTLVKQTGVKQTLVKQTLVKQTGVKQTGVKQTLVKQTPPLGEPRCIDSIHPQRLQDSSLPSQARSRHLAGPGNSLRRLLTPVGLLKTGGKPTEGAFFNRGREAGRAIHSGADGFSPVTEQG